MSKLYFYKYAHSLLVLFLSTFFIHHFHSCTKIITLISLIHSLIQPIPSFPAPILRFPTLIPRIPIIPIMIPCIPTLKPRIFILIPYIPTIPLILFPDSPFRLLQIARYLFNNNFVKFQKNCIFFFNVKGRVMQIRKFICQFPYI